MCFTKYISKVLNALKPFPNVQVHYASFLKGELTSKNVSFPTGLVEKSKTNCIFHLVGYVVQF